MPPPVTNAGPGGQRAVQAQGKLGGEIDSICRFLGGCNVGGAVGEPGANSGEPGAYTGELGLYTGELAVYTGELGAYPGEAPRVSALRSGLSRDVMVLLSQSLPLAAATEGAKTGEEGAYTGEDGAYSGDFGVSCFAGEPPPPPALSLGAKTGEPGT